MADRYQEGLTKNRNTMRSKISEQINLHIKNEKQNGNTVFKLFLDFEKAFDSVGKKTLIVKLFDQ